MSEIKAIQEFCDSKNEVYLDVLSDKILTFFCDAAMYAMGEDKSNKEQWQQAVDYCKANPDIKTAQHKKITFGKYKFYMKVT